MSILMGDGMSIANKKEWSVKAKTINIHFKYVDYKVTLIKTPEGNIRQMGFRGGYSLSDVMMPLASWKLRRLWNSVPREFDYENNQRLCMWSEIMDEFPVQELVYDELLCDKVYETYLQ